MEKIGFLIFMPIFPYIILVKISTKCSFLFKQTVQSRGLEANHHWSVTHKYHFIYCSYTKSFKYDKGWAAGLNMWQIEDNLMTFFNNIKQKYLFGKKHWKNCDPLGISESGMSTRQQSGKHSSFWSILQKSSAILRVIKCTYGLVLIYHRMSSSGICRCCYQRRRCVGSCPCVLSNQVVIFININMLWAPSEFIHSRYLNCHTTVFFHSFYQYLSTKTRCHEIIFAEIITYYWNYNMMS